MAKTPCRLEHLPLLAQSLLDTVLAASGMFAKCVVLDLDNTLWGGVIGDDGLEGIALGEFDEGEAFVGVPDVHSRTETARNHSRRGQQERARRRRAAVPRASPHGAEGRGYFRLRRQLGQQGRQHSAGPEDAEHRLRFARLSRRQSVRAQHRARVPARRRRARPARGPVPLSSDPGRPEPVRDRVVLRSRPAAGRPISRGSPARADQDALHQHQRLSDLARHGDQARAIQRLQPAAHRPAHSAQQPVQSDDAPLRRGGVRSDDERSRRSRRSRSSSPTNSATTA